MFFLFHNLLNFHIFTVTVESVGALTSSVLFIEAVKILKGKCRIFIDELDALN